MLKGSVSLKAVRAVLAELLERVDQKLVFSVGEGCGVVSMGLRRRRVWQGSRAGRLRSR